MATLTSTTSMLRRRSSAHVGTPAFASKSLGMPAMTPVASSFPATNSSTGGPARPYKDFLTPALHRRFTSAAALLLTFCLLPAALLTTTPSSSSWLWHLATLISTTLLLFLSCLFTFILRVMNLHIGRRTTTSTFKTAVQLLASPSPWVTCAWYVGSAALYGEVYIWGRGESAHLGWVDAGRAYERARLNENPLILRAVWVLIALGQTVSHFMRDVDWVAIDVDRNGDDEGGMGREEDATVATLPLHITRRLPTELKKLSAKSKDVINRALLLALTGVVFSLPPYFLLIRRTAWSLLYPISRALFSSLPPSAPPPGIIYATRFFWQALSSSFILVLLWELSNAIFTIYVEQPPLKKDQPLTSEIKDAHGGLISRSRDPNGSLLRGLKAKSEVTQSFAFAELYLICTDPAYSTRRKTIFTEVDRARKADDGGSQTSATWKQIYDVCLRQVTAISVRIADAQQLDAIKAAVGSSSPQSTTQAPAYQMPRIADRSVQNEDAGLIPELSKSRSVLQYIAQVAEAIGKSPGAPNPVVPPARRAIEWTASHVLSDRSRSSGGLWGETQRVWADLLRSPIAEPFRETSARKARAVVLGQLFSAKLPIECAVASLAALIVASLVEDDFGVVAADVGLVVRAFTQTLVSVEAFLQETGNRGDEEASVDEEVKQVLRVLRKGLEDVVLVYGEYAQQVGLSRMEVREAREAIGRGSDEARGILAGREQEAAGVRRR